MQVDPSVTHLKFEHEVARLREQRSVLEARGIFLLGTTEFPRVELVYVPRHNLRLAGRPPANLPLPPGIPEGAMVLVEVPSLAARAFKARFDLTDYDLVPPSLEFHDPWTDELLPYATMFRALEYEQNRKSHVVLLDDHPVTHKPFLCLRGIREYHEHPQHSGDDWMLYRGSMSFFSIVLSVWRVAVDLVHPQVVPTPAGIQVLFAGEEKA